MADLYSVSDTDADSGRSNLLLIVIRRKFLVFGSILFGCAIAGLVAVLESPVYESRAVLKGAQVSYAFNGELVPDELEQPSDLVQRLRAAYPRDSQDAPSWLHRVTQVRESANQAMVELRARGKTPAGARDFLDNIVGRVSSEQRELFNDFARRQQAHIELLEKEIDKLNATISLVEKKAAAVAPANNAERVLAELVVLEAKQRMITVSREMFLLNLASTPPKTKPPAIIVDPTMPTEPVSPRPYLMLGVGSLIGLILGCLLAFLVEVASAMRREDRYR